MFYLPLVTPVSDLTVAMIMCPIIKWGNTAEVSVIISGTPWTTWRVSHMIGYSKIMRRAPKVGTCSHTHRSTCEKAHMCTGTHAHRQRARQGHMRACTYAHMHARTHVCTQGVPRTNKQHRYCAYI